MPASAASSSDTTGAITVIDRGRRAIGDVPRRTAPFVEQNDPREALAPLFPTMRLRAPAAVDAVLARG